MKFSPLPIFSPLLFCIVSNGDQLTKGLNGSIIHYGLNNGLKALSGNIGMNFVKCEHSFIDLPNFCLFFMFLLFHTEDKVRNNKTSQI